MKSKKIINTLNKMSALKLKINLQNIAKAKNLPKLAQFKKWITAALTLTHKNIDFNFEAQKEITITIRLVGKKESAKLNNQYRHKNMPTNILSFSMASPIATEELGDLVICIPIVKEEARAQNKTFIAHIAHLVIHGTLHLLGYTHDKKRQRAFMESLEIEILKILGYKNPYE